MQLKDHETWPLVARILEAYMLQRGPRNSAHVTRAAIVKLSLCDVDDISGASLSVSSNINRCFSWAAVRDLCQMYFGEVDSWCEAEAQGRMFLGYTISNIQKLLQDDEQQDLL